MLEKETIAKNVEIRWTGVADIDDLYETLKDWLNMMNFGDEKKTFIESRYQEKAQGEAKQIEVDWSAEREIDAYVSFMINVRYQINGLVKVEQKQGERTIHTEKADYRVFIDGVMITDPKNKWNPLLESIYQKFMIKGRLDNYREDLYKMVYALQKTTKNFFNLRD